MKLTATRASQLRSLLQEVVEASPHLADRAQRMLEWFRVKARLPKMPGPSIREERDSRRRAHAEEIAEIRLACIGRARGRCEACGLLLRVWILDHWLGGSGRRREQQSIETCWVLCSGCNAQRTANLPSAAYWNIAFEKHCFRHGYPFTPHIEKSL